MRTLDRFAVMTRELRGLPLPAFPAIPGRAHSAALPEDEPDITDLRVCDIARAAGITRRAASLRLQRAIATGDASRLLAPKTQPAAAAAPTAAPRQFKA